MATLGEIKQWNAAALGEAAHTVQQRQQKLIQSGDDFGQTGQPREWTSAAASNAASAHQALQGRMNTMAAGVSVVLKALRQASDAIPGVQRAITDAEELARKYGYQVGDNGQVIDTFAGQPPPPEMHPEDREQAKGQVAESITQALRTADDIDNDLTSVLQRAQHGEFTTDNNSTVAAAAAGASTANPGLTLPEPPPNATPAQNAAWWASLSGAGQNILLHDRPAAIGGMNGLPAATRSAANTARLPGERAALQHQLEDAKRHLEDAKTTPFVPGTVIADAMHNKEVVANKLRSLDAIDSTMAQGNRQLLTLDSSGQQLKAAVAVGNVDTAKHVSVFTPGYTSTVSDSLNGYDSDMQNLQRRTEGIARRYGDGGEVANVTWIGYEAPQEGEELDPSRSVASDDLAQKGAPKLNGFLNGIGASHEAQGQPLHLTALGHSYGSLTTGMALQQPNPVDDAAVFGSPGMNIDNVHELKVPEGHAHSLGADQDNVPNLNIAEHFGKSPYDLPGFDRMDTGAGVSADGTPLHATHEHGQYLDEQSTSQYNMAAVAAGRPDLQVDYVPPPPSPPPQMPTHR